MLCSDVLSIEMLRSDVLSIEYFQSNTTSSWLEHCPLLKSALASSECRDHNHKTRFT